MQSRTSTDRVHLNYGLVPGVFMEVLWDIELSRREGRRSGERSVQSSWWRAEVTKVEQESGKVKAQLRYEGRDGFNEQVSDVWVFPRHLRLVEDNVTQLRWRFFECSGEVSYDLEDDRGPYLSENIHSTCTCDPSRVDSFQEKVGTVLHQYETIERMFVAQNLMFNRFLGAGSTGDRQCAHLFSILSHKIALLMQKPIPPLKAKRDNGESSSFFEDNCIGSLSVDVDCDYDTFQTVARVVRSKIETACYRPSFPEMQLGSPSNQDAEIVFESFGDLTRAIGKSSSADLTRMCIRQRGNCGKKEQGLGEVAVRVIGTCVFNPNEEKSAMAILVCNSIHEGSLAHTVDAFVRESREFDFASRMYEKRLVSCTCTRESLLRTVFKGDLEGKSVTEQVSTLALLSSMLPNFSMRWSPLTYPNSRTWSRSLSVPQFSNGILELEIPFLLFRGSSCAGEVMEHVTDSYIRRRLKDQKYIEGDTGNMKE